MKPHVLHLAFLVAATATGAYADTTQTQSKFRFNYNLTTSEVPPNWTVTTKYAEKWVNVGEKYECSNWSPSTSSQGKGLSFIQTATDCLQDQEKDAQNYRVNNINSDEIKDGDKFTIKQTITVSSTRQAIGILENWLSIAPTFSNWIDTNALYGCTAWSPSPSTFAATNTFTQTSNTCKTDQERQRQEREQERFTAEIRSIGQLITEQQTLPVQTATRSYSVVLGDWTAVGETYECSNWSPAVETMGKGIKFTQTATDCKLKQTRTRAESFRDHKTGQAVQVSTPNENRTLANQAGSKESTGTLEEWMAITPTYTTWINTSEQNGCSNWAPSPATKISTSTFVQTAANCTTNQTRDRQDREKEQNTGEIRDKGVPVVEVQTLTGQSASRNYSVTLGAWTNSSAKYACFNWSPAPSTVTVGQSFTQTATDCKQDQARSRAEAYVDHKSGSTVPVAVAGETQTLTGQSNTQAATGTKETWVATTSTYTAWANTSGVYGCTNWSPAPTTVTIGQVYTQTATNCSVNQSRTRQDREAETTTGAIRNNGASVTETQTIGGQTAARSATGTKQSWAYYPPVYGAWYNTSGYYSCSSWSPTASTMEQGVSFTQSAYCYLNQARSRQDRLYETTTGQVINNGGAVTETQTIGKTAYQTAYGTRHTK